MNPYQPFGPGVTFHQPAEDTIAGLVMGMTLGQAPAGATLAQLKRWGKRAIQATRRGMRHGSANTMGFTRRRLHTTSDDHAPHTVPRHAYRFALALDELYWAYYDKIPVAFREPHGPLIKHLIAGTCSGLSAKSGTCGNMAAAVFVWLLNHVRNCRVVFVKASDLSAAMKLDDHSFILLVSGQTALVVDAWVRTPMLCFPNETVPFYNITWQKSFFAADVRRPAGPALTQILRLLLADPDETRRNAMSDEERALKADTTDGSFNEQTSLDIGRGRQYGESLEHGVDLVELMPPPRSRSGAYLADFI